MTKTVLYYNRGNKCCLRLLASLYSLRKVWNGLVTIILEGEQEDWFIETVEKFDVVLKYIDDTGVRNTLNNKSSLWRYVDNDLVMFMDADTIVCRNIDEYFDYIEEYGFVTGQFSDWKSNGSKITKRIYGWKKVLDKEYLEEARNFGPAINTGINGWKRNDPALLAWERMCALGEPYNCTKRISDEIACQLILHTLESVKIAPAEWGTSVNYGIDNENIKIIHYHGKKHLSERDLCSYWKSNYREMVKVGILEKGNCYGDKSLSKYIEGTGSMEKYPITVVTAVNNEYKEKFIKGFLQWIDMPFIKNHPMIIFVHEDCWNSVIWNSVKSKLKDIKLIKVKGVGDTTREKMLSTFVFEVAKHVKTKYWVKLDCDASPKVEDVKLTDDIFKATLTGHKWGYTRCKGDPEYEETKEHWLHKLDRLCNDIEDFKNTSPLFEGVKSDGARMRHPRIASFFAIEKTAWTKHMADICNKNNNGRMLIPSQDTMSHYMITRLGGGRTVLRKNFKTFWWV